MGGGLARSQPTPDLVRQGFQNALSEWAPVELFEADFSARLEIGQERPLHDGPKSLVAHGNVDLEVAQSGEEIEVVATHCAPVAVDDRRLGMQHTTPILVDANTPAHESSPRCATRVAHQGDISRTRHQHPDIHATAGGAHQCANQLQWSDDEELRARCKRRLAELGK